MRPVQFQSLWIGYEKFSVHPFPEGLFNSAINVISREKTAKPFNGRSKKSPKWILLTTRYNQMGEGSTTEGSILSRGLKGIEEIVATTRLETPMLHK